MKTVIVSCFHNLISRNILDTGVLEGLLAQGVHVVLLVPFEKEENMRERFGREQVVVVGVQVSKVRSENVIHFLSLCVAGFRNHLIHDWKRDGQWGKFIGAWLVHVLFSRFFVVHRVLRLYARRFLQSDVFDQLFQEYKPSLVFVTDLFDQRDRYLLGAARRHGIRTEAMVRSWDNATSKGVLLEEAEHIIAPNVVLKEELAQIHRIAPEKVEVVGVPHYDMVGNAPTLSREAFCAQMGLRVDHKIILFAPGGSILYLHDKELLAMLKRMLDEGAFGERVQFLVRCPPGDTIDTSPIDGDSRFVVDKPGVKLTSRRKDSEMTAGENGRLNNSLHHSNVVLSVVSTIAIDGQVFGKPVVVIGFDPPEAHRDSVLRLGKEPHIKKIVATGLLPVARSEKALGDLVRMGLDTPQWNQQDRAALLQRYTYALDGKSAERVVEAVIRSIPALSEE